MNDKTETVLPSKFAPRVPIVGTLKIGDVEGKMAKKLDHMRLCTASATGDNRYLDHPDMEEFNKGKNKHITVTLISEEPRVNLDISYAMGGKGYVVCRGDGIKAERRLGQDGKIAVEAPFFPLPEGKCGETCPFFAAGKCKLVSTLYFAVPGHTDIGSVWQFRTTAWNTAQDLLGAMEYLQNMTGGVLARIPLKLYMTEQKRNPIANGARTTSKFWTLALAFDGTEEELVSHVENALAIKAKMKNIGIATTEDILKAQPKDIETIDGPEAEAFSSEFFPSDNPDDDSFDVPEEGHEPSEWTEEERAEAKQVMYEFADYMLDNGMSEKEVEAQLAMPRRCLGVVDVSPRAWMNRLYGRKDRLTKKIAKGKLPAVQPEFTAHDA